LSIIYKFDKSDPQRFQANVETSFEELELNGKEQFTLEYWNA